MEASREEPGGPIRLVAELANLGDFPVYYLSGCSALCAPEFPALYQPIYFRVIGPNGSQALVEYPCEGPFFCAPFPREFAAHDSIQRVLEINGTAWEQQDATLVFCGTCIETQLEPGRYTVVATSRYSISPEGVSTMPLQIDRTLEFDWP